MLVEIIRVCKSGSVPVASVQLRLKSVSDIFDGRPIDFDSMDFDENVRLRNFDNYVKSAVSFLLGTKLCVTEARLIDNGTRCPMEINYINITRFGTIFAKSPYFIQLVIVKAFSGVLLAVAALKKYRWIFSVVSLATAAFTWAKAHDITSMMIVFAILAGTTAAFIAAWVGHLLGIDGHDN